MAELGALISSEISDMLMPSLPTNSEPPNDTITLASARNGLIKIWLVGAFAPTSLLIIQSILGKYGESVRDVWAWFTPLVIPTIALMIGIMGGSLYSDGKEKVKNVRKSYFNLACWLSVSYLLMLSLTILLEPMSPYKATDLFGMSSYWLAPIQGLVVGAVGYLFTSEVSPKGKMPTKNRKKDPINHSNQ